MTFKNIIFVILIIFCFILQSETSKAILNTARPCDNDLFEINTDLDNDKNDEIIMLVYGKGFINNTLLIFNKDKTELLWQSSFKRIWKIQIADFEGDGIKEIVSGVWKFSPVHKKKINSISVHNWENNFIHPKWRGSTMSKNLVDFITLDINSDGYDELICIEKNFKNPEKTFLVIYEWNSFGFIVIKQFQIDKAVFALSDTKDGKIFLIKNQKDYYQITGINANTGKTGDSFRYKKRKNYKSKLVFISVVNDTICFYKNNFHKE